MLDKICKELGVRLGERWRGVGVHQNPPIYEISDNTLWLYHENEYEEASMADYVALVKGELIPLWIPKENEAYYVPYIHEEECEQYDMLFWGSNPTKDQFYLDNELLFKTEEEATKSTRKLLELYKERYR